jgi:hypothetical protein
MFASIFSRPFLTPVVSNLFLLIAVAVFTAPALAEDKHGGLAGAATNPLADLMQFQFQYQYNGGHYNTDDESWTGIVQPVIPVSLPFESVPTMITRFTVPYINTPSVDVPAGREHPQGDLPGAGFTDLFDGDSETDWGDVVGFGLLLPKVEKKGHQIGVGAAMSLPLSSKNTTGSGKWQLGPAFVYINSVTPTWQWGVLTYHLMDVADGRSGDHHYVNDSFIQPILVKHFKGGYYVGSQDLLWSYDWRSEKWNLPLGVRLGKVTKFGKQPVNLFVEPIYQPENNGLAMEWAVKLNLTFLIPK